MTKLIMPMNDIVESQVIAAISSEKQLQSAIDSSCNVAFLLTGNILTLANYVSRLVEARMQVFVHIDLMGGLSNDRAAINFIATKIKPTGIITTKSNVVKLARQHKLLTIQRLFIIDKNAITKGLNMVNDAKPDAVELMPGVLPKVIHQFAISHHIPIIVGGLIDTVSEIYGALEAGALAASVSSLDLWETGL